MRKSLSVEWLSKQIHHEIFFEIIGCDFEMEWNHNWWNGCIE